MASESESPMRLPVMRMVLVAAMSLALLAPVPGSAGPGPSPSPSATPTSTPDDSVCDPSTQTCRKLVLRNNCTFDVWVGVMGNQAGCTSDSDCTGSGSTCGGSVCTCTTSANCPNGQVCDDTGVCRYPAPLGGGQKLASGASQALRVPNQSSGNQSVSWGGRFWARTKCADFGSCGVAGTVCSDASQCCTNAGCLGLFTCSGNSDCSAFDCMQDSDCPGGATCDLGTNKCNGCVSGSCVCEQDTDCRDGGKCVSGTCSGQCSAQGLACETGDCQAQEQCPVGKSGQGPMTLAEFALLSGANNYDTYDVSQVNGFNVPIMIAPRGTPGTAPAGFANLQPWCGMPGCADAATCPGQASACSFTDDFASCLCPWGLDENTCPDPLQAVWPFACQSDADCGGAKCDTSTLPGTCECRRDDECPGSTTCGVNVNIVGKKRICGSYVGCIDADDACTSASRLNGFFGGLPFSCKRFDDLYSCTGDFTGSCYSAGATSDCCGCPSWSNGGNSGPFPVANGCQASNHRWARKVDPFVKSFKSGCPTAYAFQYDDPTSTFNCDGATGTRLGYTVTFCPTGAPGAIVPPG